MLVKDLVPKGYTSQPRPVTECFRATQLTDFQLLMKTVNENFPHIKKEIIQALNRKPLENNPQDEEIDEDAYEKMIGDSYTSDSEQTKKLLKILVNSYPNVALTVIKALKSKARDQLYVECAPAAIDLSVPHEATTSQQNATANEYIYEEATALKNEEEQTQQYIYYEDPGASTSQAQPNLVYYTTLNLEEYQPEQPALYTLQNEANPDETCAGTSDQTCTPKRSRKRSFKRRHKATDSSTSDDSDLAEVPTKKPAISVTSSPVNIQKPKSDTKPDIRKVKTEPVVDTPSTHQAKKQKTKVINCKNYNNIRISESNGSSYVNGYHPVGRGHQMKNQIDVKKSDVDSAEDDAEGLKKAQKLGRKKKKKKKKKDFGSLLKCLKMFLRRKDRSSSNSSSSSDDNESLDENDARLSDSSSRSSRKKVLNEALTRKKPISSETPRAKKLNRSFDDETTCDESNAPEDKQSSEDVANVSSESNNSLKRKCSEDQPRRTETTNDTSQEAVAAKKRHLSENSVDSAIASTSNTPADEPLQNEDLETNSDLAEELLTDVPGLKEVIQNRPEVDSGVDNFINRVVSCYLELEGDAAVDNDSTNQEESDVDLQKPNSPTTEASDGTLEQQASNSSSTSALAQENENIRDNLNPNDYLQILIQADESNDVLHIGAEVTLDNQAVEKDASSSNNEDPRLQEIHVELQNYLQIQPIVAGPSQILPAEVPITFSGSEQRHVEYNATSIEGSESEFSELGLQIDLSDADPSNNLAIDFDSYLMQPEDGVEAMQPEDGVEAEASQAAHERKLAIFRRGLDAMRALRQEELRASQQSSSSSSNEMPASGIEEQTSQNSPTVNERPSTPIEQQQEFLRRCSRIRELLRQRAGMPPERADALRELLPEMIEQVIQTGAASSNPFARAASQQLQLLAEAQNRTTGSNQMIAPRPPPAQQQASLNRPHNACPPQANCAVCIRRSRQAFRGEPPVNQHPNMVFPSAGPRLMQSVREVVVPSQMYPMGMPICAYDAPVPNPPVQGLCQHRPIGPRYPCAPPVNANCCQERFPGGVRMMRPSPHLVRPGNNAPPSNRDDLVALVHPQNVPFPRIPFGQVPNDNLPNAQNDLVFKKPKQTVKGRKAKKNPPNNNNNNISSVFPSLRDLWLQEQIRNQRAPHADRPVETSNNVNNNNSMPRVQNRWANEVPSGREQSQLEMVRSYVANNFVRFQVLLGTHRTSMINNNSMRSSQNSLANAGQAPSVNVGMLRSLFANSLPRLLEHPECQRPVPPRGTSNNAMPSAQNLDNVVPVPINWPRLPHPEAPNAQRPSHSRENSNNLNNNSMQSSQNHLANAAQAPVNLGMSRSLFANSLPRLLQHSEVQRPVPPRETSNNAMSSAQNLGNVVPVPNCWPRLPHPEPPNAQRPSQPNNLIYMPGSQNNLGNVPVNGGMSRSLFANTLPRLSHPDHPGIQNPVQGSSNNATSSAQNNLAYVAPIPNSRFPEQPQLRANSNNLNNSMPSNNPNDMPEILDNIELPRLPLPCAPNRFPTMPNLEQVIINAPNVQRNLANMPINPYNVGMTRPPVVPNSFPGLPHLPNTQTPSQPIRGTSNNGNNNVMPNNFAITSHLEQGTSTTRPERQPRDVNNNFIPSASNYVPLPRLPHIPNRFTIIPNLEQVVINAQRPPTNGISMPRTQSNPPTCPTSTIPSLLHLRQPVNNNLHDPGVQITAEASTSGRMAPHVKPPEECCLKQCLSIPGTSAGSRDGADDPRVDGNREEEENGNCDKGEAKQSQESVLNREEGRSVGVEEDREEEDEEEDDEKEEDDDDEEEEEDSRNSNRVEQVLFEKINGAGRQDTDDSDNSEDGNLQMKKRKKKNRKNDSGSGKGKSDCRKRAPIEGSHFISRKNFSLDKQPLASTSGTTGTKERKHASNSTKQENTQNAISLQPPEQQQPSTNKDEQQPKRSCVVRLKTDSLPRLKQIVPKKIYNIPQNKDKVVDVVSDIMKQKEIHLFIKEKPATAETAATQQDILGTPLSPRPDKPGLTFLPKYQKSIIKNPGAGTPSHQPTFNFPNQVTNVTVPIVKNPVKNQNKSTTEPPNKKEKEAKNKKVLWSDPRTQGTSGTKQSRKEKVLWEDPIVISDSSQGCSKDDSDEDIKKGKKSTLRLRTCRKRGPPLKLECCPTKSNNSSNENKKKPQGDPKLTQNIIEILRETTRHKPNEREKREPEKMKLRNKRRRRVFQILSSDDEEETSNQNEESVKNGSKSCFVGVKITRLSETDYTSEMLFNKRGRN